MPRTSRKTRAADPTPEWTPTGTLTVDTVADHWQAVRTHLGHGVRLHADLAGLTRVDTAGVQLLLQARRTARRLGQDFHVSRVPLSTETCALLGITSTAANAASDPATVVGQEG